MMSSPVASQSYRWPTVWNTVTATAVYNPQVRRRSDSSACSPMRACLPASTREIDDAHTLISGPLSAIAEDSRAFAASRSDCGDGLAKRGHGCPDRRLGRDRITEQQRSLAGRMDRVLPEAVEPESTRSRLLQHACLAQLRRQDGKDVQAGGDPAHLDLRQPLGERFEQHVAAAAIAEAHPPQVTVELAALEEVCEGELLEARRRDHRIEHLVGEWPDEPRRRDQPTEAQRRGERLARRAEVGDAVRREALQRADRGAVVAELGVV